MTQHLSPPHLPMPEKIRSIAEGVTLADLLESPSMVSDVISLISNILNHSWMYEDLQTADEVDLERDLFAISRAYGYGARNEAFSHLRERRNFKLVKRHNDHHLP